jgi:hypothetical protein
MHNAVAANGDYVAFCLLIGRGLIDCEGKGEVLTLHHLLSPL